MSKATLLLICLTVLVGCLNLKLKRPLSLDRTDWPTEGASVERHSEAEAHVDPPLIEMWRYDAGAGVGPGGVLIADSVVFVGTRKGIVHAVNLLTGKRVGRKRFNAPVEGTMVLGEDLLFIPLGLDNKSVIAINIVNGAKQWTYKGEPVEIGLLQVDSLVYAVDIEARVRAHRTVDGTVSWERQLGDSVAILASPLIVGSTLVVIHEEGGAFGLDLITGEERWSVELGSPVYNTPAANGHVAFIPTTRGKVIALDARDGVIQWVHEIEDETMRFSPPAIDSEAQWVIVGGTDNLIRALDTRNGELIWESDVEAAMNTAPLVTQNTIYAGTLRSKLYALDKATGTVIWSHELTGRVKSAPAAFGDKLIVLAETQQMMMFAADTTSG